MSDPRGMSEHFRTFPCQASVIASEIKGILCPTNFRDAYLDDCLMSKYVGKSSLSLEDLAAAAYNGVRISEARNKKTNTRIRNLWTTHHFGEIPASRIFECAQQLISDCIGDFSYGIFERARFTSGASVGYTRARGDLWYKYNGRVTCTLPACRFVLAFIKCHPLWVTNLTARFGPDPLKWVKIVQGNKGFTIRKNSEEDRFACKEPTGNILVQTAIGSHIRTCLRRVGIDLNDQSQNRKAALKASIDGLDATLDLRKASDSLTRSLVALLLKDDWFRVICIARSPFGEIEGVTSEWEMISSMGNGFTFELETLVFWALGEAVRRIHRCPGRVLVYGDDIVVPTKIAHPLIAVLGFSGFRINESKSFISGQFRESCGGHYNAGIDVTPFFIRKPITDTCRMIWFLNALRKWCDHNGVCDVRFAQMYRRLQRKYIPTELWGGIRYSSISSLATPDQPRKRLKLVFEGRRINGVAAVLRTFSYARKTHENASQRIDKSTRYNKVTDGYESTPHDDPQLYYEMHGSVPITSDMTRICVVSGTVSDEDNSEQFGDSLGFWPAEIARLRA